MAKRDGLDFACSGGKNTLRTLLEAHSSTVTHAGILKLVGFNLFYACMSLSLVRNATRNIRIRHARVGLILEVRRAYTHTHTSPLMHMTQVAVRYQSIRACECVAHVCMCVYVV